MSHFIIPDLLRFYNKSYNAEDVDWRRVSAKDKADHIVDALKGEFDELHTFLEVGCGTGDILAHLAGQWPEKKFSGVEIGAPRQTRDPRFANLTNMHVAGYDGTHLPYGDGSIDVVYASHVLEHVLDERGFLRELRRVARKYVIIEVPCEQTLFGNVRKLQPSLNIGHINCYSPESLLLTLETSGLTCTTFQRWDHSLDVLKFDGKVAAYLKLAIRRAAASLLPTLAPKLFCYHFTAKCERAAFLNIDPNSHI